MKRFFIAATAAAASWFGSMSLDAQVDSNLLRRDWRPEPHWADTYDKPFYILRGDLDVVDHEYAVFHWDSTGRVKTDRETRDPAFWFGYKVLTVMVDSGFDPIDHGLYDVGLAVAGRLGSLGDGWSLDASGGAGTANDGSFSNTNAIYAAVTVDAIHDLGPGRYLHLGLTYDGNSALLPAMPLPLVEFEARLSESIRLRAGVPHAEVEVQPLTALSLLLIAEYPGDVRAHAEYSLGGGFRVFSEYVRRVDGFHLRDDGRTRLFYLLNTGEAGIRYSTSWIDLSLSIGAAFGQRFFTGYDLRERDHVVTPGDRPMVALTVQGTF